MKKFFELSLKESEVRYRRLFESAQDGILILDGITGAITDVNPYLVNMLGYSRDEFIGKMLWEVGAFKDIKASKEAFEILQDKEYIRYEDLPLKSKSGKLMDVEFVSNVYMVDDEKVIQCNIRDITERVRIETALHLNEKKYFDLVNQSPEGIFIVDLKGDFIAVNTAMSKTLGFKEEEFLTMNIRDIIPVECIEKYLIRMDKILKGQVLDEPLEYRVQGKDGKIRYVEIISAPHYDGKEIAGFQGIARDITERKVAEERIQRQLEHLTALSSIDRVITSNFDVKITLTAILVHVTKELKVDAADILLMNNSSQMLEHGADHGFHNTDIRKTHLRLGESFAGRVALERKLLHIPILENEKDTLLLTSIAANDEFVCYFGVPLMNKGQVKGVLEVFNRTPLEPDAEWFEFLEALAGQAAIAIENSSLNDNLYRSNQELTLAYDATIEGWSKALDMRDKETEGHTQRVTEMALNLARAFFLNDAELKQIRWGALLHDIGKMGISDEILFKPGPLSDEEWIMMKMHPTFAYEMLYPIHYLHLALDVPYCHHEKWDGSGYPRGIVGAQIPLFARIFSVVDVWDALGSDRPYRNAWPAEKVTEHIRASSGSHFDPQVVDAFLKVLNQS